MKKLALALALVSAAIGAAPAAAQQSEAYRFIKAIKEGDAVTVQSIASAPTGSITINAKDGDSGDGALHLLVRERNRTWIAFLLGKGARPDLQNEEGFSPLALAAQLGWYEGADLLLSRRAEVDLANDRGETPLILAVQRRDVPLVRLLLSKGADPKKTDRVAGYSAIDYARRDARSAAILKALETPPAPKKEAFGPKL